MYGRDVQVCTVACAHAAPTCRGGRDKPAIQWERSAKPPPPRAQGLATEGRGAFKVFLSTVLAKTLFPAAPPSLRCLARLWHQPRKVSEGFCGGM